MTPELIQSTLSVVAALVPLIIVIVTMFRNRIERTFYPLDSPSLKVLNIKRFPVTDKDWLSVKLNENRRCLILWIIGLLFILFISIISLSLENQYLTYILLSLVAITAIVLIYDDLKNPFIIFSPLKAKSSIEVGYFLFEKVDVTIYSNYHYLFNKCHDTLRRMKLWIIEVNEVVGTLEALQINILSFNAIRIKIQIDKFESKSDTFQIKLEFIKEINLLQRSKFTNRLINELISKPKSADQKAESKVDIPTDVGD